MTADRDDEKRRIRALVRERRGARTPERRREDRERLTDHLANLVRETGARLVTCYLPTADEPDTSGFIAWARAHEVDVLLPVSLERHRLAWARLGPAGTAAGRHGLAEPVGPRLPVEAAVAADLLLIPASAVDVTGARMGWGLGYFDRALAALAPRPPVYAVVYEEEVLPRIPVAAHDVGITGVVTPAGIRRFPIEAD